MSIKLQGARKNLLKLAGAFVFISVVIIAACAQKGGKNGKPGNEFSKYWYDGNAEISSYSLSQNRYGELQDGKAVLVFVTEDFSKQKQVKLDHPEKAGADKLPVLKMNFTKNFITGIYPYSILNSVFTPVDLSGTEKTTCSVQEWCGHTFTQINKKANGFAVSEYSYFEEEGDKTLELPGAVLEDELWNMIRINPESIPMGKVNLIRGNMAVRLMHLPLTTVEADIQFADTILSNQPVKQLSVIYPERKLKIYYIPAFPFTIQGWDETYGEFGKAPATTSARLIKTMRLPYWKLHNREHLPYRDSLGLK